MSVILNTDVELDVGAKVDIPLNKAVPLFTNEAIVNAPAFSWEELETFKGRKTLSEPSGGLAVGIFQAKTI